MTTNRDTALNTVYPSAHLAQNIICRLFDTDELTYDEWIGADAVPMIGGWRIHLAYEELSRDTTEESSL